MPKNRYAYKDKDVKTFNKKVTVVKGEMKIKDSAMDDLNRFDSMICISYYALLETVEATGKSKCSPEDTYDEKTGLIVASRKAELKATKVKLKQVDRAIKIAEQYLEYLRELEDKLDYKVVKLSVDLIAKNRE